MSLMHERVVPKEYSSLVARQRIILRICSEDRGIRPAGDKNEWRYHLHAGPNKWKPTHGPQGRAGLKTEANSKGEGKKGGMKKCLSGIFRVPSPCRLAGILLAFCGSYQFIRPPSLPPILSSSTISSTPFRPNTPSLGPGTA